MAKRSYTSNRGGQQERKPQDFDLDGVAFVATGSVSMLDISEFARLAAQGLDSKSPQAVAFLADVFLSLLGPEQYRLFREHTREHHTDPAVLLDILNDLVAGAVEEMSEGRPTDRSSDSSDGPPTGEATARVVSFSRATVETKPVEEETKPLVSYG